MAKLKTCPVQNKVMYPTRTVAIRAAIKSSQRRGGALRVYKHHACGAYHLTSKPRVDILDERNAS